MRSDGGDDDGDGGPLSLALQLEGFVSPYATQWVQREARMKRQNQSSAAHLW